MWAGRGPPQAELQRSLTYDRTVGGRPTGRLEEIFTNRMKGGCAHVKRKRERVAEATDKNTSKAGQVTRTDKTHYLKTHSPCLLVE